MRDHRDRVYSMPKTVTFEPRPGGILLFSLKLREGIASAAGLEMIYPSCHVFFLSAQRGAESIDGTFYEEASLGTLDHLIEKLLELRDARDAKRVADSSISTSHESEAVQS